MSVNLSQPSFVHLRCHSEYSIVDGTVRIDDYVEHAVKDQMPALALSDLSNLFGAIKFYKAARGQGIKPLLACDLWLENSLNRDQPYRLMLLCQTLDGYTKLCALISRAYLENQYRGRPEIRREWLIHSNNGKAKSSYLTSGPLGVHRAVKRCLNFRQCKTNIKTKIW